jgi:transposase InsO family protein
MEERARFVLDALRGHFTMTELCERYGVSRKTGYKWVARYHGEGAHGCNDRLRSPRNHPNKTKELIAKKIILARRKRPGWGPVTLRAMLLEKYPDVAWPCPSTIGAILKREGLVKKRRKRVDRMVWRTRRTRADRPNQVWTADFKGQFRLGNGVYCYPLTIMDAFSRYLLVNRALKSTAVKPARQVFEEAFREYGLPEVIHTDNGVPFCFPMAPLALSTLSVWFLKLGISLERSRPGKPQDNGSHERMHRTLKEEVAHPPRYSFAAQQRALDRFRKSYNEERPHHALGLKPPTRFYTPSERPYPEEIPDPVYPKHFEVRWVSKIGVVNWKTKRIFVSTALAREPLGFEHVADDLWSVFFGITLLGRVKESEARLVLGAGR